MWWIGGNLWVGVAAAATAHASLASSSSPSSAAAAAAASSPWSPRATPLSPVLTHQHQLPPPASSSSSRRRNSVGMRAMRSSLEPLTAVSEANQEELTPEHSQQVRVCVCVHRWGVYRASSSPSLSCAREASALVPPTRDWFVLASTSARTRQWRLSSVQIA